MIFTPHNLRDFLNECKASMPEINHVRPVIDDSQMVKGLSEIGSVDNLLLFGVLPDYGSDTGDEDALMMDNGLDFLVLKKQEYSDMNNEDFINDMQSVLMAVRNFVSKVYEEKNDPDKCPMFYFLKERSFLITPVWAKSGCNGYMVSFNLRTDL